MRQPRYWIIGGGRFGLQAARTLRRLRPAADITVIDPDRSRCERVRAAGHRVVGEDGVQWLAGSLSEPTRGLWIVAAAPVHVAFEWLRARLADSARLEPAPVPAALWDLLPNPMTGAGGAILASNADFLCPPDCIEAGRVCTVTGRPRPRRMHSHIRRLALPGVKKLVIQSIQLAPGVGGLRPGELLALPAEVRAAKGPTLLATACKCHAILHYFKMISVF